MTLAAARPTAGRPLVVLVTAVAALLVMLDIAIVNVALSHVAGSLNATRDQIGWVLTAYVVAMALATPLTGWLADRIGRRPLFVLSMAGFVAASAACGLATDLPQMVAFRILQGACAAPIGPLAQATLLDVTPRERHGRAMAVFAMATMLGPTLGPTLGGWLTDAYGWRWCFLINVPLGALVVFGAAICIPEAPETRRRPLDLIGYAALALGVACFQLFLDRGPRAEWFASAESWIWAGLAVLGLYWFVAHSLTAARPLFSLELVRDRNYASAAILAFVISMVLFPAVTMAPPILQEVLGYTAFDSGMTLVPRGLATIASSFVVGRLVARVDSRLLILIGIVLTAAGFLIMAGVSPQADNRLIMLAALVQGAGQGTFFVPISTIAFASLSPHLRTEGAAAAGLLRNMGTSVGLSLVAMTHSAGAYRAQSLIGENLTEGAFAARGLSPGGAAELSTQTDLALLAREIARQADLLAYVNTFYLMALLCALAAPLLLLLRPPRR